MIITQHKFSPTLSKFYKGKDKVFNLLNECQQNKLFWSVCWMAQVQLHEGLKNDINFQIEKKKNDHRHAAGDSMTVVG